MRPLIRRICTLPAQLLGAAAALCFASSQVWAQAALPSMPRVLPPVVDITTASIAGEVRDMVVKGDSIEVTYVNTGTIATAVAGDVYLYFGPDRLAASVALVNGPIVCAGATQFLRAALPKLARGKYVIVAIVDYGGENLTAAKAALDMR